MCGWASAARLPLDRGHPPARDQKFVPHRRIEEQIADSIVVPTGQTGATGCAMPPIT
jgi:hypothetical protein